MTLEQPGPDLNLELRPGAGFPANVVSWIKDYAAGLTGLGSERRQETLTALAGFIAATKKSDPRLFLMSLATKSAPGMKGWRGDGERWLPSVSQRKILNVLGGYGTGEPMGADDALTNLASAGVNDVLREDTAVVTEALRRQQQAEAEAKGLAEKVAPLEQTEQDRDAERRRADQLASDNQKLLAQVADLQSFVGGKGIKRRVAIGDGPANTGIFHALLDGELIFEIGFTDDKGVQRWRRLKRGATVEQARQLREGLQGQPYTPDPDTPDHDRDGADEDDHGAGAEASQGAGDGDGDQQTTEPAAAGKEG